MKRRAGLAGAVLSLVALAAVRGGGGGPPLYDGVCLPPQYTMLGANPGPPSQSKTYTASDLAGTFELADSDTSPQAQLIVGAGSLAPAPGSSTATVSITPVTPPATKPTDGTIDGNVYDFEARSAGQAVQVAPGHLVTIVLSATRTGGPQLAVERFDGSRWSAPAKSVQSGCGTTYQVNSATLGIFALVAQGGAAPSNGPGGSGGSGSGGGGGATIVIVIVGMLVVLAMVIGAVRMNRQRARRGKRRRR
jgi:hypothetical protein